MLRDWRGTWFCWSSLQIKCMCWASATTSITQETSWQHLTLFWRNCSYGGWKEKREVICKPEMKVSLYCSSNYMNWGGSKSPTPTIVLPLQPPHNSISVYPADFLNSFPIPQPMRYSFWVATNGICVLLWDFHYFFPPNSSRGSVHLADRKK
jgi:hypothetical protein